MSAHTLERVTGGDDVTRVGGEGFRGGTTAWREGGRRQWHSTVGPGSIALRVRAGTWPPREACVRHNATLPHTHRATSRSTRCINLILLQWMHSRPTRSLIANEIGVN